jgi:hypothetical protein
MENDVAEGLWRRPKAEFGPRAGTVPDHRQRCLGDAVAVNLFVNLSSAADGQMQLL